MENDKRSPHIQEVLLTKETDEGIAEQFEWDENKTWGNMFQSLRKDKDYRQKILKTAMQCWAFVTYGLSIGQTGPSMLDLQEITSTTLTKISGTITAAGIGYICGSLLTGNISDRVHTDLLCFIACFGAAVATAVIPWCSIYEIMVLMNLLRGSTNGIMDTAANTLLLRIWKDKRSSFMQALHFSWAFGSIISPLFTAPFLSQIPEDTKNRTESRFNLSDVAPLTILETQTMQQNGSSIIKYELTMKNASYFKDFNGYFFNGTDDREGGFSKSASILYIPYSITAGLSMLAAVFFIISYVKSAKEKYVTDKSRTSITETHFEKVRLSLPIYLTSLASFLLMMMIYVAIEVIFAGFIAAFSVKKLKWSKVKGAYITSVYSGSLCCGRFAAIFVVKFLHSSNVLILYITVLTASVTLFMICSLFLLEPGIWISVAMAGISSSVIFPGILTWAEDDFVRMTRRVTSSIMVSSSIGWMLTPLLIGFLMDTVSPMYYCYAGVTDCILVLCLYCFARCVMYPKIQRSVEINYNVKTKSVVI